MFLAMAALPAAVRAQDWPAKSGVFRKDNLVAWCIVPFDAKQRGPEERAAMLERLGITRFAYDWRDKDIPTFDQELDALSKHGIRLQAFWFPCGLEPAKDKNAGIILELLERRKLKTELWFSLSGETKELDAMPLEKRVAAVAESVRWVVGRAGKIGCSVALYNHGGWFGEPENQVAILKRVRMKNVGIVYNFHHGHDHIERFPELFALMEPHLMAVNLNGMRKGGPKILPIGGGDRELEMLKVIQRSRYRGPIGILGHREELDAEEALRLNLDGLKKLVAITGS
jgi:sugar phosphate isomerase/epimerase